MNRNTILTTAALFAAALFILSAGSPARADVFESAQTGNWNSSSTWTRTSGSTNNYPQAGDTATVKANHVVTLTGNESLAILTINADGEIRTGANTLTISGSSGLTIDPVGGGTDPGLLNVNGAGLVDLTGGGASHTINGELRLSVANSDLRISSSDVTFDGSGFIEGQNDSAHIYVTANRTLTNTITIRGRLQVTEEAGGAASTTFVNGSGGLVRANAAGTLEIATDSLGISAGNWQVSTNSSAVLKFNYGSSAGTHSGTVTMSDGGTLNFQESFTTSGNATLNVGTVIVAAGETLQAS